MILSKELEKLLKSDKGLQKTIRTLEFKYDMVFENFGFFEDILKLENFYADLLFSGWLHNEYLWKNIYPVEYRYLVTNGYTTSYGGYNMDHSRLVLSIPDYDVSEWEDEIELDLEVFFSWTFEEMASSTFYADTKYRFGSIIPKRIVVDIIKTIDSGFESYGRLNTTTFISRMNEISTIFTEYLEMSEFSLDENNITILDDRIYDIIEDLKNEVTSNFSQITDEIYSNLEELGKEIDKTIKVEINRIIEERK